MALKGGEALGHLTTLSSLTHLDLYETEINEIEELSKLPQLRYCTPSPVTDGQRSAAEALRGRQLTGMVLSIPRPQVAPKTSVLDILSVPCAEDGPVQVLHGGVKMPQLSGLNANDLLV